jgi:UDP-N-acetylmuramyl pentapeptide phosphotransferase/UDP-N-acetylglucosamine-1-phosphate transferase
VVAALVLPSSSNPPSRDGAGAAPRHPAGGTVLVLTGFIDDQFELPPLFRLAVVQPLAAALLVANASASTFRASARRSTRPSPCSGWSASPTP